MSLTTCGHESTRGTTLLRATALAGPYVEIGAIEAMPEITITATTDTCTDQYGDGADAWVKEYKTGEFDGGDAGFTVNWISGDAQHAQLQADLLSTSQIYLRIALSDVAATTIDFPYLVKSMSRPLPGGGGKVQLVFNGKVNGEVVES